MMAKIPRPKSGTVSELPWSIADGLSAQLGRTPTRHEIKQEVYRVKPDYAPTTFNVQVAAWARAQLTEGEMEPDVGERIATALEHIADALRAQAEDRAKAQDRLVVAAWPTVAQRN